MNRRRVHCSAHTPLPTSPSTETKDVLPPKSERQSKPIHQEISREKLKKMVERARRVHKFSFHEVGDSIYLFVLPHRPRTRCGNEYCIGNAEAIAYELQLLAKREFIVLESDRNGIHVKGRIDEFEGLGAATLPEAIETALTVQVGCNIEIEDKTEGEKEIENSNPYFPLVWTKHNDKIYYFHGMTLGNDQLSFLYDIELKAFYLWFTDRVRLYLPKFVAAYVPLHELPPAMERAVQAFTPSNTKGLLIGYLLPKRGRA